MAEAKKNGINHIAARRSANAERQSAWKAGIAAEAQRAQVDTTRTPKKRALILLLEDMFPGYQPVIERA